MSERTFFLFWWGLIYSTWKTSRVGIWYNKPFFFFVCEFPLLLLWGHFTNTYVIIFFYKEILCKFCPLQFYKGIPIRIDRGPPTVNFTKEFPFILIRVHFTKNSLGNFFTGKSLYFFSQLRNLKLSFIPIKKLFHQNSKIPKIYLSWALSVPSFRKIQEPFCGR